MIIDVMYHDEKMPELEFIGGDKSDWIDVRACKIKINGEEIPWKTVEIDGETKVIPIKYYAGEDVSIDLGISVQLPKGREAHLLPRGGTYKNYGMMLVNSEGIIDESYKGKGDHWIMNYLAIKSGTINLYDRIGQFRTFNKMVTDEGMVFMRKVETLDNEDRGGFTSSGVK